MLKQRKYDNFYVFCCEIAGKLWNTKLHLLSLGLHDYDKKSQLSIIPLKL